MASEIVTEYHCPRCGVIFSEPRLPNINKIHKPCGGLVRIIRHFAEESGKDDS